MKTETPPSLPDKPSELVRVARRDLKAVMNQPRKYVVSMKVWHVSIDGKCVVCQAGAVMARTLKADAFRHLSPSDMGDDCDKLRSLNLLRQGNIISFCCGMDIYLSGLQTIKLSHVKKKYVPYETNPGKYLSWLRLVETALKECGL